MQGPGLSPHAASHRLRADLDNATREFLTTRLLTWLTNETNFAVPTSSAKGRITLAGNSQPGTVKGEIVNSMLMYKNFPITLGMTHLARGLPVGGHLEYVDEATLTRSIDERVEMHSEV